MGIVKRIQTLILGIKELKSSMELNYNFGRGGLGVQTENLLGGDQEGGGGGDMNNIFWNHTITSQ